MNTIGSRIKQIRKEKQLTQVELGQLLGITGAGVSYIESGGSQPTEAALKLICATYHVHYLWLTTGEGPMYETASGDALIDKYAPDAEDHLKKVFREMAKLPDSAWESLREYIAYMLAAVDQARDDHATDGD